MAEKTDSGQIVVYLLYERMVVEQHEGDDDYTGNWNIIFSSIDKANEWLHLNHKECLTFCRTGSKITNRIFSLPDYETMEETEFGSRFYLKEIVVDDMRSERL